jgi:DNA polymerase-3 subunit epsilon/ATP-dependent DNA helicase DinG
MPRTYVALDLETTGLNPERDAILEVGAVKYRDGAPVETFSTLINPGRPIPYDITLITGISNDMVIGKPPFEQVAPAFRQFVGPAPIVGQNVSFDLGFLKRHGLFIENPTYDTWELASVLVPGLPSYSLGSLALHFGVPSPNGHRALNDAQVTAQLFEILRERAAMLPRAVVAEILRLASHLEQWGVQWGATEVFREAAGPFRSFPQPLPLEQIVPSCALFDEEVARSETGHSGARETGHSTDIAALSAMLEPGGVFSEIFPGYEHRPQQVEMLQAVAQAFDQAHHLMAEAGTGTGKSLAYLLPAIAHAAATGERVVISTNTINLQDQLFKKDLPDLQLALSRAWGDDEPFRATLLKGRANYLCMKRFEALRRAGPSTVEEMRGLARILVWLLTTRTGDAAELSLAWSGDRNVWAGLSANSEGCSLEACGRDLQGRCFFYRVRKQAEAAHVIVVNHALLMSDAATGHRVLPEYKRLIVDEAHHLETAVTEQLSFRVDGNSLAALFNQLYTDPTGLRRPVGSPSKPARSGLLGDLDAALREAIRPELYPDYHVEIVHLQQAVESARRQLDHFWQVVEEFARDAVPRGERDEYEIKFRITAAVRAQPYWVDLEVAWDNLSAEWNQLDAHLVGLLDRLESRPPAPDKETGAEVDRLAGEVLGAVAKLVETYDALEGWVMRPSENQVYWVEAPNERGQPGRRGLSLRMAPVHIGDLVQQNILWRNDTVVLTSATLRTGGSFDYVRHRLAAEDADCAFVGSPFDYRACTLLYLPSDLPEPNSPQFQAVVDSSIVTLAKALNGRTLALFTSYAQLKRTANTIGPALTAAGITVLSQAAGGSRHQLLETFKTSERTVLLGTRSFWEGVDVVGPALSALVLVRLPFAVPSDPIVAARSETFDDPFHQYQVPDAILRFRQGFGRLIRSKTDRGVVLVLDKRVTSKQYGKLFLESLPECTVQEAPLMNLGAAAKGWVEEK